MPGETAGGNILVVDDSRENLRLLATVLKRGGLHPRPVTSGALAIEAALAEPPDLVLLDITMPDMSGLDVCRWLKLDDRLKSIPVLFISGRLSSEDKLEAFAAGGLDYISKPFEETEIIARIRTHLRLHWLQQDAESRNDVLSRRVAEQVRAVTASQLATIFAIAKLAEARDDDTGRHIERVQSFARLLAESMQRMKIHSNMLTDRYIDTLYQTASLHDIGKVGVRDGILQKRGPLTGDEFREMQKHCALGADTLAMVLKRHPDNEFLRMGEQVARSHHERWDGSGYPNGLKGAAIPLAARIVAVADVYDALTSDRCYRAAVSPDVTCGMIHSGMGAHFDPELEAPFAAVEDRFQRLRKELRD